MSGNARSGFARWLFLCAIVLGVVSMHHVGAEPGHPVSAGQHAAAEPVAGHHPAAATPADGSGSHTEDHALGHLCLAILSTVAVLALALLFLHARRDRPTVLRRGIGAPAAARGPPPTPGRQVLLTSCVLRL